MTDGGKNVIIFLWLGLCPRLTVQSCQLFEARHNPLLFQMHCFRIQSPIRWDIIAINTGYKIWKLHHSPEDELIDENDVGSG